MQKGNNPVWVIVDQIDCRVQNVSFQLIGRARKLADELQTCVQAVLLGYNIDNQASQLIAAGADRVFVGNSPKLAFYEQELYSSIIVRLARQCRPQITLLGSTLMSRELAPMVAAGLGTGLTAHCIDLVLNEDGVLEQKIPAYGGLLSIVCPEKRPQMATVAAGVFPNPAWDASRTGEIVPLDIPDNHPGRIQTLEVVRQEPEGMPLEMASIVVAGGAGAGDPAGWQKMADLANVLRAALGCTRPVVDEGWAGLESMIGQSGKMVNPQVYIGLGLSGELQHMVGIVGARIMVAVNNDAKSPVFEQVDYGIVDDCRKFLPVLIEKINEFKEKQITC